MRLCCYDRVRSLITAKTTYITRYLICSLHDCLRQNRWVSSLVRDTVPRSCLVLTTHLIYCHRMAAFETEALLVREREEDDPRPLQYSQQPASQRLRLCICLILLMTCRAFYQFIAEIPFVRLFERVICRSHLDSLLTPEREIDEELCKAPAVQDRLALVMGMKMMFDGIPGAAWKIRLLTFLLILARSCDIDILWSSGG